MSYGYDEDADLEMFEIETEGRAMRAAERQGVCFHNSSVGLPASGQIFYPEQVGLKAGERRCTDRCGLVFTESGMDEDRADKLAEYL